MKRDTSKFIKKLDREYENFFWQGGYGLFSVSPSNKTKVIKYIEKQMEHHKKMSFQQEFRAFLKEYGIKYNENYIWD